VRHSGEKFSREAGDFVDEAGELTLTEHDALHVALGDDGRVSGGLLEQRELAEGVARAEGRDLAAVSAHAGGPAEDHEELVARLALGDQGLSRRDSDVLGPAGDELEVLAGARREEGNLLEVVDERIATGHGPEI